MYTSSYICINSSLVTKQIAMKFRPAIECHKWKIKIKSVFLQHIPATALAAGQGPPSGAPPRTAGCWPASAQPWSSLKIPGNYNATF